jgi:hypothetical protein
MLADIGEKKKGPKTLLIHIALASPRRRLKEEGIRHAGMASLILLEV